MGQPAGEPFIVDITHLPPATAARPTALQLVLAHSQCACLQFLAPPSVAFMGASQLWFKT